MQLPLWMPIISALFFLVGFALLYFAFAYRRLAEQFEKMSHAPFHDHITTMHKAEKILREAREDAFQIIEKSEHTAEAIVLDADLFRANTQKALTAQIEAATQQHLREYQKQLSSFRTELDDTFAKLRQEIHANLEKEFSTLRTQVHSTTEKMAAEEIAAYKTESLKQIDRKILKMTQEVMQEIAPNLIPAKEHETLVIQALTQAKERHAI